MSAAIEETQSEGGEAPQSQDVPVTTQTTLSQTANWRDSLPPDLKDNPTLSQIPDIQTLAKNHVNVQKLIGTEKIERPKEDWTPDQFADFYTKLGRPADSKDYDLEGIDIPESLPWDNEFQDSMLGIMHEAGLTQAQVQKVLGGYISKVGGDFEAATGESQRTRESGIQDLRNEWGKSFDAKVDLAKRAFMAGAGQNFEQVAGLTLQDGSKLGDHPAIIRAFASLGGKMNEHGLVGGKTSNAIMSPKEASGQRNKLLADPEFLKAYLDATHLEHNAAVDRIKDLTIMEVGDDIQ